MLLGLLAPLKRITNLGYSYTRQPFSTHNISHVTFRGTDGVEVHLEARNFEPGGRHVKFFPGVFADESNVLRE
jgi:hypothetical protein